MNILLAIAHYTTDRTPDGAAPLTRCLAGWRGLVTWGQQDFGGPCQAAQVHTLDILVVDDGVHSAAEYLPAGIAERISVEWAPVQLPLACRALLDERRGEYAMLGYSEHDNWPITPDYIDRACAHATADPGSVLIPNRFERIGRPPYKVYIDGPNGWGDYGALWLLTAAQWTGWRKQSHFLTHTDAFAGPLESGCAWSLMQTFRCVKPRPFARLESEHWGDRYAQRSIARGVTWCD